MKLKNKRTGEIGTLIVDGAYKFVTNFAVEDDEMNRLGEYNSLAELNEEGEDVPEEPEGWWFIDRAYEPHATNSTLRNLYADREIGNYFETKEEAEKAVEKLKAWKRLKDKGFKFGRWQFLDDRSGIWVRGNLVPDIVDELDILFGGEE